MQIEENLCNFVTVGNKTHSHFFMKKYILVLIALTLLSLTSNATPEKKAIIEKLRQELAKTNSHKDSIKILYDIFDLSNRKDYTSICGELDQVAAHGGDIAVRLDMARQMANVNSNDSVFAQIESRLKSLPDSKEKKETELFVRLRRLSASARNISEKERQERIARTIVHEDKQLDKYGKIERLFIICEYLSVIAKGDLLVGYLEDLGELIRDSGLDNYALKNIYHTECANIYTVTGNHEKAIAADKLLLKEINNLEKSYRTQGRKYRNLDVNRFIIYRRMLSNYEALSVEEANELYSKILSLAENNDDIKSTMEYNRRASAYHAMKNKRYAEAIPYIRRQLSIEDSHILRKHMLEMLVEASQAIGDKTNEDLARKELEAINKEISTAAARQKYDELQIRYDVSALREENAELELENKNEQIQATRRIMIFVIVGWVAFAILMIAFLFFWSRYRRTTADIASFVDTLVAERDAIKKRRYYDYAKKTNDREYHASYRSKPPKPGNISETVDYIINDVMFISSVAFEDSRKYRKTISVTEFMKDSISTLESTLDKNININALYPEPDFEIKVDKECLGMLTDHILKVAVRLTHEGGSVGFECTEDTSMKMARFVFKHSGNALPEGKEEKIFEYFFKYKELSEKGEAALIMVRMINFLTNCSLKSSSGHTGGGKLVLMVPMS